MTPPIYVTAASAFWPGGRGVESVLGTPVPGRSRKVADEDLASALTLRGLRPLSRTARLAMVAAADVWPPGTSTTPADGVVFGSRWASSGPLADFVQVAAAHGADRVFPMAFPNTVVSVHAGYVASMLGLTGPVVSLCGEAAGLESVVEGLCLIAAQRADRVLSVGADAAEAAVALARPDAAEAAGAVRLSRTREENALAVIGGWWVAARAEDLPEQAGCAGFPDLLEGLGDCGAARGVLRFAAAADLVRREGHPVVMSGRCGVRGVAAVRIDPA